jgi:hypothetical protein
VWGAKAKSETHAANIAEQVIELLRRGQLWDQLGAAALPASSGWEPRLRRALGLHRDGSSRPNGSFPAPKSKVVRMPPSAPFAHHEAALQRNLQLRRKTGADAAPAMVQLVGLYTLWSAGEDGEMMAVTKGLAAQEQLLERHRRGPPVDHALEAATRWSFETQEDEFHIELQQHLLRERLKTLGREHPATTQALVQLGRTMKVGMPRSVARATLTNDWARAVRRPGCTRRR